MPANLENTAVATGLEKVSFHSNPKERKGDYQKWLDAANQLYEDLGENAGSEIIEPED